MDSFFTVMFDTLFTSFTGPTAASTEEPCAEAPPRNFESAGSSNTYCTIAWASVRMDYLYTVSLSVFYNTSCELKTTECLILLWFHPLSAQSRFVRRWSFITATFVRARRHNWASWWALFIHEIFVPSILLLRIFFIAPSGAWFEGWWMYWQGSTWLWTDEHYTSFMIVMRCEWIWRLK